ncbi:histidine phosphatase family protein [Cytobacillus sp. IB215665]|uniref:histidine phosphatase family protein n=1 Tax=Cytobacillus sp. IB215665 TaxID=3097357 RepID=UPI002A1838F8|nr:histidine phosphatase family protein [Cytobacillus sp. IB215665]MDX8365336.1 histidine phosphatase family protein [Cytobacillus sp. IB215665]
MVKKIYIVRHCEAQGQPSEAQLTNKGFEQARLLSDFFSDKKIDRIISSSFIRAIQSIEPLSVHKNVTVEVDQRLTERILSEENLADWLEKLKRTYDNLDAKYKGGESSREAMNRISCVVNEIFNSHFESTIIVTHGNIMSLLLKKYNHHFGFDEWKSLSNPDVYLLTSKDRAISVKRVWQEGEINEI